MDVQNIEKLNQLISRTDMTGNEKVEWLIAFTENYQALQLLQTDVVGRSEQLCDFEHHNADIRRAYTCSECGGRKLK